MLSPSTIRNTRLRCQPTARRIPSSLVRSTTDINIVLRMLAKESETTITVIAHAECDYRAPAFVHEELEIAATLVELGRQSFTAKYTISNVKSGRTLAEGKTTSVTIDPETHRPVELPAVTRARFERILAVRPLA